MAAGQVLEWHAEEGWGVLSSTSTPHGCWAHFSALDVPGYREVRPGDLVAFDYERADQDGYEFRALSVRPIGLDPQTREQRYAPMPNSGPAYQSTLTIWLDDGRVFTGDAAHDFVRQTLGERPGLEGPTKDES